MENKVIVKEMSENLIKLARIKSKAESRAETAILLGNFFTQRRELARTNFWLAVKAEYPDLQHLDVSLRYSNTLVFKPYTFS